MSSGQWEVVGKNKKSQNGKVKVVKDEDKKTTRSGPKPEDVVAHSQPKQYYSGMEIDDPRPSNGKKNAGKKNRTRKTSPRSQSRRKQLKELLKRYVYL
ncbi:hypothetical protein MSG28_008876 [Choristoneura fumiferana]|uniref:Uncharacterized protein n=1 Tax=Choristoneura fumiferana TaxID=7141 RepID=A0ACC0J8F9_CHOFU|nr:hypothetical protein MSG28_008876 [Choristoneura fumiferana]